MLDEKRDEIDGGTEARSHVGRESMDDGDEWRKIDRRVRLLARRRAALDAEEAAMLVAAKRAEVHVHLGLGSFIEYMERVCGHAPHAARERLRVAEALEELPAMREALAAGEVSFSVARGEKFALVGESGSGKTVSALSVLRLNSDAGYEGQIRFEGHDLLGIVVERRAPARAARIVPVAVAQRVALEGVPSFAVFAHADLTQLGEDGARFAVRPERVLEHDEVGSVTVDDAAVAEAEHDLAAGPQREDIE